MTDAVLSFTGFEYAYAGAERPALSGVDLDVRHGELVVLAGRSGSGKSTLLRAACGLVPHFHGGRFGGEVVVDGRSTRDAGPAELAVNVGFVAQEPESQVVSTTVRAELALPLELRGRGEDECARAVEEVALALGIEGLLERTTDALSGGELQRVSIASALVTRPPLLLLDEPTSQLDPVAGDELIALLRRLNEEWGVTVLLGEHRLERCLPAADRVLALEAGRLTFDGSPDSFGAYASGSAPWLATPGMRMFELAGRPERPRSVKQARLLLGHGAGQSTAGPRGGQRAGKMKPAGAPDGAPAPALSARGLAVELDAGEGPREVVRDVDLRIGAGELVALVGPNGAGKSTLMRAAAGVVAPSRGSIEAPAGCALLTQRPDDYFVRERIDAELPGEAGERAMRAVALGVDRDRDPRDLSGGERQRLALAIAMAGRGAGGQAPGLVCLDEPTRGLDRERKAGLVEWLRGLAAAGSAVVVATHDVEFAAAFSRAPGGRVILLGRGRILADGAAEQMLAGGWYFATEVARITGGRAITAERGAALLAPPAARIGDGAEEAAR
jgi:energy-coupling factor transport system ATP-binding protein